MNLEEISQEEVDSFIAAAKTFHSIPLKRLELTGEDGRISIYKVGSLIRIDISFDQGVHHE